MCKQIDSISLIFNGRIIQINYRVPGGSGIARRNMILISTDSNNFYCPLFIESYESWDVERMYDKEVDDFNLYNEHGLISNNIKPVKEDSIEAGLLLIEYYSNKSKYNQFNDFEVDTILLHYDAINRVFINQYVNLNGLFYIVDKDNKSVSTIFNNIEMPAIITNFKTYYFYNEKWYTCYKKITYMNCDPMLAGRDKR